MPPPWIIQPGIHTTVRTHPLDWGCFMTCFDQQEHCRSGAVCLLWWITGSLTVSAWPLRTLLWGKPAHVRIWPPWYPYTMNKIHWWVSLKKKKIPEYPTRSLPLCYYTTGLTFWWLSTPQGFVGIPFYSSEQTPGVQLENEAVKKDGNFLLSFIRLSTPPAPRSLKKAPDWKNLSQREDGTSKYTACVGGEFLETSSVEGSG